MNDTGYYLPVDGANSPTPEWANENVSDLCPFPVQNVSLELILCLMEQKSFIVVLLDKVLTPVWIVIGILGNSVSIKIWAYRRTKRTSSSALYLAVLAFVDLLFLIVYIPTELKYTWTIFRPYDTPYFCEIYNVLSMLTQYLSPLLVFGFTIECYLSVCKPFRSERFSRHHRSPKEIIVIVIFCFLVSVPQAGLWTVIDNSCEMRPNVDSFFEVWTYITEIIFFGIVPFLTLLMNILVLRSSRNSLHFRRESTCASIKDNEIRVHYQHRSTPSTYTLVCVSMYRIFAHLPSTVIFVLQIYIVPDSSALTNLNDPSFQRYITFALVKRMVSEWSVSYRAFSFFVYYLTTRLFREELKRSLLIIKMHLCLARKGRSKGHKPLGLNSMPNDSGFKSNSHGTLV